MTNSPKSGGDRTRTITRHYRDFVQKRIGRLQILAYIPGIKDNPAKFDCLCDCGKRVVKRAGSLFSKVKSCGCLRDEVRRKKRKTGTHFKTKTKTHRTWLGMRNRCRNPNHRHYASYGGRGIKVCKRWDLFENFLSDMGEQPNNMSLDRINNDKSYSPKNCRWATHNEQMQNTRWTKLNAKNVMLARNMRRKGATYKDIASEIKVSESAIWHAVTGRTWKNVPLIKAALADDQGEEK